MHLMLDLETLGTDPRSVILSIGAVFFTETEIGKKFYVELDADEQTEYFKRKVSMNTVAWWIDQDDDAKQLFSNPDKKMFGIALSELHDFIGEEAATVEVWSNGASFDIPMLNTAFHDVGLPTPWRFYNERCYRTMKNLVPGVPKPDVGTKHNALDDALAQALHLQAIWQEMRHEARVA